MALWHFCTMPRAPLTPVRVNLEAEGCCTSRNWLSDHPMEEGLGEELHQQSFQEPSRAPRCVDISKYSLQN